jgi:hypothetical protein
MLQSCQSKPVLRSFGVKSLLFPSSKIERPSMSETQLYDLPTEAGKVYSLKIKKLITKEYRLMIRKI